MNAVTLNPQSVSSGCLPRLQKAMRLADLVEAEWTSTMLRPFADRITSLRFSVDLAVEALSETGAIEPETKQAFNPARGQIRLGRVPVRGHGSAPIRRALRRAAEAICRAG